MSAETPQTPHVWWQVKATKRVTGLELAVGHGATPEQAWDNMLAGAANKAKAEREKLSSADADAVALARLEKP